MYRAALQMKCAKEFSKENIPESIMCCKDAFMMNSNVIFSNMDLLLCIEQLKYCNWNEILTVYRTRFVFRESLV